MTDLTLAGGEPGWGPAKTYEAELHQRLRDMLDFIGTDCTREGGGCNWVKGCDRPGRYWLVVGFIGADDRVYDEEGFVHAALDAKGVNFHHLTAEEPRYRYRSPRRPLDINWLPEDVRESFDMDAFLAQPEHIRIGTAEERLTAVFTFGKPIPEAFAERWGLVLLGADPLEVTDGYPH